MIPQAFVGIAISAVASGRSRLMAQTSHQLGMSVPALVQEVLRLVEQPEVVVAHPRACRQVVERRDAAAAARSAVRLSVRSEV